MIKLFLDTNIVLDFILKREGFAKEAAIIFDLGERKKIQLFLSSLSINNIDYVVSKIESKKKLQLKSEQKSRISPSPLNNSSISGYGPDAPLVTSLHNQSR